MIQLKFAARLNKLKAPCLIGLFLYQYSREGFCLDQPSRRDSQSVSPAMCCSHSKIRESNYLKRSMSTPP